MASKINVDKIARGSGTPEFTIPTTDGTTGQFLKTDGSGVLAFDTVTTNPLTLTGSTNNTIPTVTGANALAGEANLTFDGSTLQVLGTAGVGIARTEGTLHVHTATAGSATAATNADDLVVETTTSPCVWEHFALEVTQIVCFCAITFCDNPPSRFSILAGGTLIASCESRKYQTPSPP